MGWYLLHTGYCSDCKTALLVGRNRKTGEERTYKIGITPEDGALTISEITEEGDANCPAETGILAPDGD